jgi:hypothetical protein
LLLLDATVEIYFHEKPLPESFDKTACLKISCADRTFFLASIDEHLLWNVWSPKLKEITAGEETLSDVSPFANGVDYLQKFFQFRFVDLLIK